MVPWQVRAQRSPRLGELVIVGRLQRLELLSRDGSTNGPRDSQNAWINRGCRVGIVVIRKLQRRA